MKKDNRKDEKYISRCFTIFSIFFIAPILSPAINGKTLYIEWFIPFFDMYFFAYLFKLRLHKKFFGELFLSILLFMIIILAHGDWTRFLRVPVTAYVLIYLYYIYENIGFSILYKVFNISIYIALVQALLFFINPSWSYLIGPQSIAQSIWGQFATSCYTNFYSVSFLPIPRFCGLSREAGFFVALLSIMFVMYMNDKKIIKTWRQIVLYMIAFVISLSKMSIALPLMYIIYKKRNVTSWIPFSLMCIFLWIGLGFFSVYLRSIGYFNEPYNDTYIHRLGAYSIIVENFATKEMFFGSRGGIEELNDEMFHGFADKKQLGAENENGMNRPICGFADIVICVGYIGMLVYLMILYILRVSSIGLVILLLGTFDVSIMTVNSFVPLVYFFVFVNCHRRKMPLSG